MRITLHRPPTGYTVSQMLIPAEQRINLGGIITHGKKKLGF